MTDLLIAALVVSGAISWGLAISLTIAQYISTRKIRAMRKKERGWE